MTASYEEIVFNDGDTFFEAFFHSLETAKKTIDLESYIFDLDELGNKILDALEAATKRGVKVRLLIDGAGCSQWTYPDIAKCKERGIQIRVFHPMPWHRSLSKAWQRLSFQKMALGFAKINHRNHRKTCCIDGQHAFIGSINMSARHLKSYSPAPWRDTSVRIAGCDLRACIDGFEEAWKYSDDYVHKKQKNRSFFRPYHYFRVNITSEHRQMNYQVLIDKILSAKKRIWITNPYFVPDHQLIQALQQAALANIDVRALFPKEGDIFEVKCAMEGFYSPLLNSGVRIYEYLPSILHAKILIIDDWVSIGSSNLDHRSLFSDLEADVVLRKPENIELMKKQFLKDLQSSKEMTSTRWNRRPLANRVLEKVFLRFKEVL